MTKFSEEEIMQDVQKLANAIGRSEGITIFKQAEEKVHRNKKVTGIIAEIKKLQKEAVNLQHINKKKALADVEERISILEGQLAEIPIVEQYKQSQAEVNDFLQQITSTISSKVTDEINKKLQDKHIK